MHVWCASLDLGIDRLAVLQATLAPEEWARAGRFQCEAHRRRFVAGRGLLRRLLGTHLGVAPAEVRFSYAGAGKPALVDAPELEFNLSHAQDLALYAVSRGRALGVDLERVRPEIRHERIASRFLSAREQADLADLPAAERLWAFYDCWTRKEAYLKARGDGLALGLGRFSVSLRPGEPAALLEAAEGPQECARWRLEALDPAPGYAAAVCAAGQDWTVRCWRWAD